MPSVTLIVGCGVSSLTLLLLVIIYVSVWRWVPTPGCLAGGRVPSSVASGACMVVRCVPPTSACGQPSPARRACLCTAHRTCLPFLTAASTYTSVPGGHQAGQGRRVHTLLQLGWHHRGACSF